MAEALDNIFSVIIESEMIAQAGKQQQKEVKDSIERVSMRLKKQQSKKEAHEEKKTQLELAVADASIGIKVLKVQEESNTDELRALEKKIVAEKNKLDDLGTHIIAEYETFVENVNTFSTDYSLSSSGTDRRIQFAKDCLRSLEGDREKLKSDVQTITNNIDALRMVLDEKWKEKTELAAITGDIDEIDKQINIEVCCSKELENKISQLVIEPDHSSTFMRLKDELHAYDVTNLEAEIDTLQTQLQLLTRQLQKKEAQSLRLQYRLWQRQQKHKSGDHVPENRPNEENVITISDDEVKQEI